MIALTEAADLARFDGMMEQQHALGSTPPVGDFLRQVAVLDGEWVGLLAWGSAALHLKDRDEWVGWNGRQRKERLKLVANNRRFLLPGRKGEHPNRASQVLAAALRALPEQWEQHFGYRPVLAETFTDPEAQAGTCYKAAGWLPLGHTAGYGRHRADFFTPHGRPKKLWVKELCAGGRGVLAASAPLPAGLAGGAVSGHGALPLPPAAYRSLFEALRSVPDPRARSTTFRIGPVLTIVVMALLCGCRDVAGFHRFGQSLAQQQRALIGLPRRRGGRFRSVPGYGVYRQVLCRLELEALARVLSAWLRQRSGSLPTALALDGKMIRDTVGVLALAAHDSGEAHALAPMRDKDDGHPQGELTVAQRLLEEAADLEGRVVTADALHCQRKTARIICAQGGEYLLQIKGNQPGLHARAQQLARSASPLLT
jgi:hypothetical protein